MGLLGIYENNVVSFFFVLEVGAGSSIITLKWSPEGLTCTAAGPNLQEVGRGPVKTIGRTRGEKTEVLSLRQLSSTCRVQVTEQVNDNDGFWTPRGPGQTACAVWQSAWNAKCQRVPRVLRSAEPPAISWSGRTRSVE